MNAAKDNKEVKPLDAATVKSNLLYTKTAAVAHLNQNGVEVKSHQIASLRVADPQTSRGHSGAVVVYFKNQSIKPRAVPKSHFNNYFVQMRQEGGSKIADSVIQDKLIGCVFYCPSTSGLNEYKVTLTKHLAFCPCEDMQKQLFAFAGIGCCKHGYAVLQSMGFRTMKEYRKSWESGQLANFSKLIKQKSELNIPQSDSYSAIAAEAAM